MARRGRRGGPGAEHTSADRFRVAFANAPIGMALVAPDGRWLQVNHAMCERTGYRLDQLLATNLADITHPDDVAVHLQRREQMLSGELRSHRREKRFVRRDGSVAWVNASFSLVRGADGEPQYFILQASDVTDRKEAEAVLHHRALHDALTGLPNRLLLMDRLAQSLARRRRDGTATALLFCDLDRFKHANDSLGHEAGDELLVEFARRLAATMRPGDTAARFGGDEFVLLYDGVAGVDDAIALARRVQAETAHPCRVADTDVTMTLSIGVVVAEAGAGDPEGMLRDADAALYQAKQRGRDRFELFDESLRAQTGERRRLEEHLRNAVNGRGLRLEYQPIVDLKSGRVDGAEALLRWDHPVLGPLAPTSFLDVAEDTGLIVPVGAWVLREACADAVTWPIHGKPVTLAVNVSARQLVHPGLVDSVEAALETAGLPPSRLRLDLPESAVAAAVETAAPTLQHLRRLGVTIALDDFGTGESSLTALQHTRAEVVKLDSSLVASLDRDGEATRLVSAVIGIGTSLGLVTIAEGVETAQQAARLRDMGCALAQGYLFGRPNPASEFPSFLSRGTRNQEIIARTR